MEDFPDLKFSRWAQVSVYRSVCVVMVSRMLSRALSREAHDEVSGCVHKTEHCYITAGTSSSLYELIIRHHILCGLKFQSSLRPWKNRKEWSGPNFGLWSGLMLQLRCSHSRRIDTEEKAKVVAAVWGPKLIKFLAALAILHQDDMKKRMNYTRMSL